MDNVSQISPSFNRTISTKERRRQTTPQIIEKEKIRRISDTSIEIPKTLLNDLRTKKTHHHKSSHTKISPRKEIIQNEIRQDESPRSFLNRDYLDERSEQKKKNQESLIYLYQCLKVASASEGLNLHFDSFNCLGCNFNPKDPYETQKIYDLIYMEINNAISLKNILFFNGIALISVLYLDELFIDIYPEKEQHTNRLNIINLVNLRLKKDQHIVNKLNISSESRALLKELSTIFHLQELKIPEEDSNEPKFKKSYENKHEQIEILQTKKDEINKLLAQITDLISRSKEEVSHKQTISALNLYKSTMEGYFLFLEFHWAHATEDEISSFDAIKKHRIKNSIVEHKNLPLERMNEEIKFLASERLAYNKCILKAIESKKMLHIGINEADDFFTQVKKFPKDISTIFQLPELKTLETIQEKLNFNEQCLQQIQILQAKKKEIEDLIVRVTDIVNREEGQVTYLQKVTVMNFYKNRVQDYLIFLEYYKKWDLNPYIEETKVIKNRVNKSSLKIKINDQNKLLNRFNDEIEFLSQLKTQYDKQPIINALDIDTILSNHILSVFEGKEIEALSDDLMFYSASSYRLETFDTCWLSAQLKLPGDVTNYSNSLSYFVFNKFNDVIKKHKDHPDFTIIFLNIYDFFVKLTIKLMKKHDYHSAYAISLALQNPLAEWVIHNEKILFEKEKRRGLEKRRTDIKNDLRFISNICNSNFTVMKDIVVQLRKHKIFHVPYAGSIQKALLYQFDNLKNLKNQENWENLENWKDLGNSVYVEKKTLEIMNHNDYFNEIRFNYETASKTYIPKTNIMQQIDSCRNPIEMISLEHKLICALDEHGLCNNNCIYQKKGLKILNGH